MCIRDRGKLLNCVAHVPTKSHVKGQCQCTSTYGCFHCKLKINDWNKPGLTGALKEVKEMAKLGEEALKVLGKNPDKDSKQYSDFQLNHYGQWVRSSSRS